MDVNGEVKWGVRLGPGGWGVRLGGGGGGQGGCEQRNGEVKIF